MDKVVSFLASKNISAHTFAALALGAFGLYVSEPAVKAYVDGLVGQYPQVKQLLALAVILYARYAKSGANQ